MTTRPITLSVFLTLLALATPVWAHPDFWKPVKLDLEKVAKLTAERAKSDPLFIKQPTILAFKTALFLSTGSFDVANLGRVQSVKADFGPGEEFFEKATVTIEFMGYTDDVLAGERFTLTMRSDDAGNWAVEDAKRERLGWKRRGAEQGGADQPATSPESKPSDVSTTKPESKPSAQ